VKDEEIKHRWQKYFDKMFNGEIESSTPLMILAGVLCGTSRSLRLMRL
jgi:hypothetical protein